MRECLTTEMKVQTTFDNKKYYNETENSKNIRRDK